MMFIAVHAGAGYHSPSLEDEYKKLCKEACRKGMDVLEQGESALEAVTESIKVLEDSPITNAGCGSNLTIDGHVECDASIMLGKNGTFGGVGAVRGIKNPISVSRQLVLEQQNESHPLGLVPPMLLVGEGAHQWAKSQGIVLCSESDLKTKGSVATHKKNQDKLKRFLQCKNKDGTTKRQKLEPESCQAPLDTVGAVCVGLHGRMCAGVSSGGIILKHSGRVGQAASFGAGCWASEGTTVQPVGVACCTSGCGEHLMKTLLAKECALTASTNQDLEAVKETFEKKFLGSPLLPLTVEKHGGILLLRHESPQEDEADSAFIDFTWGHTTQSMCIGYMKSKDKKPKAFVSRLRHGCTAGKSLLVEGIHWKKPLQ